MVKSDNTTQLPRHRTAIERTSNPMLFEIAWEVCNQIGGIYTVIKTKVPAMQEAWGKDYFLIGPYNTHTAAIEFEEAPPDEPLRSVLKKLEQSGLTFYYGRWLIEGRPNVILLDFRPRLATLERDKYFLWKDQGVECSENDSHVNEAVAFGFMVCEFFKQLTNHLKGRPIIAHFHEWMAGVAVPRMAALGLPVARVFTTHATLLGRYMASDNPVFYEQIHQVDPYQAARHYNIMTRFSIERVAAHGAHVFSTISDVTAREAEQFLGRKATHILPNGLNVQRFTALHEFQNLHLKYKERIHDFVMGHFFPSYTFDLDRTLYIFTSGRYEYRNKGMDVFIEALFRLNQRLKEHPDPPTIVAFIITRAATKNINVAALQNQLMFDDLKNICADLESGLDARLLAAVTRGRLPTYEELLPRDFQVRLKRGMHAMRSSRLPLIVTHDLHEDAADPVLQHLRHRRMFNSPTDAVKVVFHPEFMTATSPLVNLDYDQFVRGCHLGIFPSYYEPWGYTPLESIALGLPAVTTDLSGFGAFVEKEIPDSRERGIMVLKRAERGTGGAIDDLAEYLYDFVHLNRRERIELRNRAERLTERFDWSALASHYHKAHSDALRMVMPETIEVEETGQVVLAKV